MKIQKRLLIEVPKTKDAAAVNNDKKTTLKWQLLQNSLDKTHPSLCPPKTLSNFFDYYHYLLDMNTLSLLFLKRC